MFEGKAYLADGVYKNERKIGCLIPDMADIPVGEHKVFVDVSFNGQQFTNFGKVLLYNCKPPMFQSSSRSPRSHSLARRPQEAR
jgi:hypothetical protein